MDDSPSLLIQSEASSCYWGTAASTNVKRFDHLCDGEGFSGQDQCSGSATHSSIDSHLPNSQLLNTTHEGTTLSDLGSRGSHRQPVLFCKQCYMDLPSGLKEDLCYSCMTSGPEHLGSENAFLFDDPALNTAIDMSFVDPRITNETIQYHSMGNPLTDFSQVGQLEATFDTQSLLREEPLQPFDNVAFSGFQGDSFAKKELPLSLDIKSRSHVKRPFSAAGRGAFKLREAGACWRSRMMRLQVVLDTINWSVIY